MGTDAAEDSKVLPVVEPAPEQAKEASESNSLKDADAAKPLRKASPEREATAADYIVRDDMAWP